MLLAKKTNSDVPSSLSSFISGSTALRQQQIQSQLVEDESNNDSIACFSQSYKPRSSSLLQQLPTSASLHNTLHHSIPASSIIMAPSNSIIIPTNSTSTAAFLEQNSIVQPPPNTFLRHSNFSPPSAHGRSHGDNFSEVTSKSTSNVPFPSQHCLLPSNQYQELQSSTRIDWNSNGGIINNSRIAPGAAFSSSTLIDSNKIYSSDPSLPKPPPGMIPSHITPSENQIMHPHTNSSIAADNVMVDAMFSRDYIGGGTSTWGSSIPGWGGIDGDNLSKAPASSSSALWGSSSFGFGDNQKQSLLLTKKDVPQSR